MRRVRGVFFAAFAGLLVLAPLVAPRAQEDSQLAEIVREQGLVIEQLRAELAKVREDQQRSQDRVRALEDGVTVGRRHAAVTPDYVDERIQAFDTADESRLLLSGYGTAQLVNPTNGPSTFLSNFNPIFHFRLSDRLHFNGELEIALTKVKGGEDADGGGGELGFSPATELGLEFATIDYLATDWLTLSAGQFLLPFNFFGPKLHPQWVNKLASMPPIYGAHDRDAGGGGIIPVLSDVGVMVSGGRRLWSEDSKVNYAVYAVNGPEAHEPDHPELDFHTPDDNSNKASGVRIGFLPIPNLEVGASYLTGRTNGPGGRFNLVGSDAWYRTGGLELRGEFVRLARDAGNKNPNVWGYYVQAAYRLSDLARSVGGFDGPLGRLEPVLRWGAVKGFSEKRRDQLALGINYWVAPSVPFKVTYELNGGATKSDRLLFQFAYGF